MTGTALSCTRKSAVCTVFYNNAPDLPFHLSPGLTDGSAVPDPRSCLSGGLLWDEQEHHRSGAHHPVLFHIRYRWESLGPGRKRRPGEEIENPKTRSPFSPDGRTHQISGPYRTTVTSDDTSPERPGKKKFILHQSCLDRFLCFAGRFFIVNGPDSFNGITKRVSVKVKLIKTKPKETQ